MAAFGWLLARAARQATLALRMPHDASAAPLARGALAALVAALAHGMVDTFYFWPDLAIGFWLLLAVIAASAVAARRQGRI